MDFRRILRRGFIPLETARPKALSGRAHARARFLTGFTLFEIIIVIAIVAILAVSIVAVVDPPKLYARARNTERQAHLNSIAAAVGEHLADRKGDWSCSAGALPTSTKALAVGAGNYDIGPCLVPAYLDALPFDPSAPGAHYASITDYATGYALVRNATTGAITLTALSAELGASIAVTR